jgi:hypothetical protein
VFWETGRFFSFAALLAHKHPLFGVAIPLIDCPFWQALCLLCIIYPDRIAHPINRIISITSLLLILFGTMSSSNNDASSFQGDHHQQQQQQQQLLAVKATTAEEEANKKPAATTTTVQRFYCIRKCQSLTAPALFLAHDDCSFYLEQEEPDEVNDPNDYNGKQRTLVEYQTFDVLVEAMEYLLGRHLNFSRLDSSLVAGTTAGTTTTTTASCKRSAHEADLQTTQAASRKKQAPPTVVAYMAKEGGAMVPLYAHQTPQQPHNTTATKGRTLLQASVSATITNPLSTRKKMDKWLAEFPTNFALLQAYKKIHKTCDVPRHSGEHTNKGLGEWVFQTRDMLRAHQEEEQAATKTATSGDPLSTSTTTQMQTNMQQLLQLGFVRKPKKGRKLHIKRQNAMEKWEESFEEYFLLLKRYKERFGSCDVPQETRSNSKTATTTMDTNMNETTNDDNNDKDDKDNEFATLGPWVLKTRLLIQQHEQDPSLTTNILPNVAIRIRLLLELGFVMKAKQGRKLHNTIQKDEAKWEEHFQELQQFKQLHGHANVPHRPSTQLRTWVMKQKKAYTLLKEGKQNSSNSSLTAQKVVRLTELGLSLQTKSTFSFDERAYAWLEHKTLHGTDPRRYSEDGTCVVLYCIVCHLSVLCIPSYH